MSVSNLRVGYISGPMRGYADHNYPAFNLAARLWREAGYTIYNPAETFGGNQGLPLQDYMRLDLMQVIDSDFIIMLPGWENSEGANIERNLAQMLGKPEVMQGELESVPNEAELRERLRVRHRDASDW